MEPLSPDSAPTFDVVFALRRHWRLIALVAIGFALIAAGYEVASSRPYSSSATVQIRPIVGNAFSPDTTSNSSAALQTETQVVGTIDKKLLTDSASIQNTSPAPVLATVNRLVGCSRSSVTASVLTNAFLIKVSYLSTSAELAQRCAQNYAQAFLDYRTALAVNQQHTQTVNLTSAAKRVKDQLTAAQRRPRNNSDNAALVQRLTIQLDAYDNELGTVLSLPTGSGSIVAPAGPATAGGLTPIVVVIGAAIVGLLLGMLLAITRARRNRRILTERNEANLGLPVLTRVGAGKDPATTGLPLVDPIADEDFRVAAITVIASAEIHTTVAVSPMSEHGSAAAVSIRLARGIAAAGYSVVLVDATTAGPHIASLLGIAPLSGLSDLVDGADLDPGNLPAFDGVKVLGADTKREDGHDRYAGRRLRELLDELKAAHDYVLVSASAFNRADGLGVLLASDYAVLIADDRVTTYEDIAQVRALAERLEATLVGLVVAHRDGRALARPAGTRPFEVPVQKRADTPGPDAARTPEVRGRPAPVPTGGGKRPSPSDPSSASAIGAPHPSAGRTKP